MPFSFLNIDPIKNLRGLCIGNFDYYTIFLWNSFFPIGVTILLALVCQITKPRDADAETSRKHSSFYWNAFCMLLFLVFPGTSKCVVSMFHCHPLQVDDNTIKEYLYIDYDIECWTGDHDMYAAIAGVMIVLYPVGIPMFFILSLLGYSRITASGMPLDRARKEDPDVQSALVKDPVIAEQLGFLYSRFKPDYWWYETTELVRKLLIGTMTMFILPGTATQTIVAVVFNTYFLCQLLVCWPFKAYDDNMLMSMALAATSITLFGALIIQGHIDVLDQYEDGVTSGLLLGTTITLFILYATMLLRFQLPFVCNWFMPAFIRESPLNCFRPPARAKFGVCERCGMALGPKDKFCTSCGGARKVEAAPKPGAAPAQVVLPPPPPPPPPQQLERPYDDEEQLDQLIIAYFHRYDLDESSTLNTNEELKQLSTNLSFKLRLTLTGDEIDAIVKTAGDLDEENEWLVEEFGEWYKDSFLGIFDESAALQIQGDMATMISMSQNADMNADLAAQADDGGDGGGD